MLLSFEPSDVRHDAPPPRAPHWVAPLAFVHPQKVGVGTTSEWKTACMKHKSGGHQFVSTTNKRTVLPAVSPVISVLVLLYMNDAYKYMSG
jgi:hypothetical protein